MRYAELEDTGTLLREDPKLVDIEKSQHHSEKIPTHAQDHTEVHPSKSKPDIVPHIMPPHSSTHKIETGHEKKLGTTERTDPPHGTWEEQAMLLATLHYESLQLLQVFQLNDENN